MRPRARRGRRATARGGGAGSHRDQRTCNRSTRPSPSDAAARLRRCRGDPHALRSAQAARRPRRQLGAPPSRRRNELHSRPSRPPTAHATDPDLDHPPQRHHRGRLVERRVGHELAPARPSLPGCARAHERRDGPDARHSRDRPRAHVLGEDEAGDHRHGGAHRAAAPVHRSRELACTARPGVEADARTASRLQRRTARRRPPGATRDRRAVRADRPADRARAGAAGGAEWDAHSLDDDQQVA